MIVLYWLYLSLDYFLTNDLYLVQFAIFLLIYWNVFGFVEKNFTFILAPFPSGLVVYWAWNNILSMGQQWLIKKKLEKK